MLSDVDMTLLILFGGFLLAVVLGILTKLMVYQ